jgi:hypothetical protein
MPFAGFTWLCVADEAVGMASHVDGEGTVWEALMEHVQGIHDVLLRDVAVGSLGTGHKIGLDADQNRPRSVSRQTRALHKVVCTRTARQHQDWSEDEK